MGVDVRMYVTHDNTLTDAQVRRLSADIFDAMYGDFFYIDKERDQHALSVMSQEEAPLPLRRYRQIIEVSTLDRYYGPGYERGNPPAIIAVAEWLDRRIPGCTIWYDGDCCDDDAIQPFDRKARLAMLDHWAEHGHAPYHGGFGRFDAHDTKPICSFCQVEMADHGGGGDRTFFVCHGCDGHFDGRKDNQGNWNLT